MGIYLYMGFNLLRVYYNQQYGGEYRFVWKRVAIPGIPKNGNLKRENDDRSLDLL